MTYLNHQPLRVLYAIGSGLVIAASLPWILIKNSVSAARPHKGWTYRQSVATEVMRSILWHSSYMRVRTPLDNTPGSLGDRLEVIQPASKSQYTGILSSKQNITPVAISGVWYPDVGSRPPSKENPVILHFHGGSFVTLDARPGDCGFAGKMLGTITPRVLIANYRLSSNPGGIFPAALQDALTAYLFLLKHEGDANNIILSGDSTGANLVLGLLRYIYSDEGKELHIKAPRAALLWSPWVDVASIHDHPEIVDQNPRAITDYVSPEYIGWGAKTIGTDDDVRSPYLTSIGHPFSAPETPLWYQAGDAEILYDEIVRSFEEMQAVPGNKVSLFVAAGANHDLLLSAHVSGFTSQTKDSVAKAKEFLEKIT